MKNYVLFDFDGTVFDSAEGITKSVQYALGKMGIHAETSELMCFAGPPLDEMFSQRYGMDEETAHRAVEFYRERYTPIGWEECSPFPGMHELMGKLHAKGIKLAVATSKPRVFAQKILEKYSMQDDFDLVCGSEFNGERGQKWEVIEYALEQSATGNTTLSAQKSAALSASEFASATQSRASLSVRARSTSPKTPTICSNI